MAVISNSTEYAKQISVSRMGEPTRLRSVYFSGTTASAAMGDINLIKLPPGKLKVLPALSTLIMANGAATANVSVGYAAHTASNGVAVSESNAAIQAARLVNAHTVNTCNLIPVNAGIALDSMDGVTVRATVSTANTAANGAYEGCITFIQF